MLAASDRHPNEAATARPHPPLHHLNCGVAVVPWTKLRFSQLALVPGCPACGRHTAFSPVCYRPLTSQLTATAP